MEKEAAKLRDRATMLSDSAEGVSKLAGMTGKQDEWSGLLRSQADKYDIQAKIKLSQAEKERERYAVREREQFMREYEPYRDAEDWTENSRTAPEMMEHDEAAGIMRYDPAIRASRYKDAEYAIINGDRDALNLMNTAHNDDFTYLTRMDESDRAMYNYLYADYGREAAKEYLDKLTPALNQAQRAENAERWKAMAAEDPFGTSVFSVLISPAKAVSFFGQAADYLDDGMIDQNAAYNRFVHIPGDIRAQVSEMAEESWGKKGSFLYQTGMSMADFLWSMAASGGSEAVNLAILGSNAAADTVAELWDRGMDSTRAFALGAAAGLAEVVTESVSLETLLKPDRLADRALRYILKNTLAEAGEEASSDILNWAADALYDLLSGQNESRWKQDIRKKERQGLGTREAAAEVLRERLIEVGLDGLGGAISGSVLSGARTGMAKAIDATEEFRRALDEVFGRTGGEAEDEAFRRTLEKELRLKELTEDAAGDIIDYPDKASAVLKLPDIEVGRSVGAKAQNYDIMDLKTGEHFQLVEGSHLQNVEVFAGKGTKSQYRKAEIYANDIGGKVEKWQHVKGIGEVNYYGESRKASIHWSQCEGYGKHDFFIKEWLE